VVARTGLIGLRGELRWIGEGEANDSRVEATSTKASCLETRPAPACDSKKYLVDRYKAHSLSPHRSSPPILPSILLPSHCFLQH